MSICTVDVPATVHWDLESVSASVKDNCESALSIAPTLPNLQALKLARAQLNSDHKRMDLSVSQMKTAYMTPWDRFKGEYDLKISAEYQNADSVLKAEITELEDTIRSHRAEMLLDHIERLTGTRDPKYLPEKILLSASDKQLVMQVEERVKELSAPIVEKVFVFHGREKDIYTALAKIADTINFEEVE